MRPSPRASGNLNCSQLWVGSWECSTDSPGFRQFFSQARADRCLARAWGWPRQVAWTPLAFSRLWCLALQTPPASASMNADLCLLYSGRTRALSSVPSWYTAWKLPSGGDKHRVLLTHVLSLRAHCPVLLLAHNLQTIASQLLSGYFKGPQVGGCDVPVGLRNATLGFDEQFPVLGVSP